MAGVKKEEDREETAQDKKSNYEGGIVTLLALLGGIVMMNRLAIVYLFPFIIPESKVGYAQAGALTSNLAIASAFEIWFSEGLSDRYGRKIILIQCRMRFAIFNIMKKGGPCKSLEISFD